MPILDLPEKKVLVFKTSKVWKEPPALGSAPASLVQPSDPPRRPGTVPTLAGPDRKALQSGGYFSVVENKGVGMKISFAHMTLTLAVIK